jgi:hypothetical protein
MHGYQYPQEKKKSVNSRKNKRKMKQTNQIRQHQSVKNHMAKTRTKNMWSVSIQSISKSRTDCKTRLQHIYKKSVTRISGFKKNRVKNDKIGTYD